MIVAPDFQPPATAIINEIAYFYVFSLYDRVRWVAGGLFLAESQTEKSVDVDYMKKTASVIHLFRD